MAIFMIIIALVCGFITYGFVCDITPTDIEPDDSLPVDWKKEF